MKTDKEIYKQLNITGTRYGQAEIESIVKATLSIQRKEILEMIDKWWDNLDIKTGKEIEELKKQIGEE